MAGPPQAIDGRTARRRFERAAATYAKAARLELEVGARMLERLDYMKIAPRRILDAGSGPSREGRALSKKYPGAELISLDFSLRMLRAGRPRLGFLAKDRPLCADFVSLPLAAGAADFVWSNMALHWATDPFAALKELHRVLAPEGLFMFSALGPDSLKELRVAAGAARVHDFIDMHDLGDMLVAAGFSAPVVDMEMLRLVYREERALLADLRRSGQTSARVDRPRGLAGKGFFRNMLARLGREASFEVVYGHAWKSAPRQPEEGRGIVRFHPIGRRLS